MGDHEELLGITEGVSVRPLSVRLESQFRRQLQGPFVDDARANHNLGDFEGFI